MLSSKLFLRNQIPDGFHEPYIISGYRHPGSTAKQCLRSLLECTNETFNIWSHLLPFVYFCWMTYDFWRTEEYTGQFGYPMMCFMVAQCMYPVASCVAHIFNAMSERARHICFFFDYFAISMYGLGTSIAYRAYVTPEGLIGTAYENHYLKLTAISAIGFTATACHVRFMPVGTPKSVLRIAAPAIPFLCGSVPLFCRILFCQPGECQEGGLYFHKRQFVFILSAFFMYASHIPERFFPVRFDIIGHSHQFFHILIVLATHDTTSGILVDLQEKKSHLEDIDGPLIYQGVNLMMVVGLINLMTVLFHVRKLYHIAPGNQSYGPVPCQPNYDTKDNGQNQQNDGQKTDLFVNHMNYSKSLSARQRHIIQNLQKNNKEKKIISTKL